MPREDMEGTYWAGPDVEAKFWERVRKGEDPDACWLWDGSHAGNGYPKMHVTITVHRYAYTLLVGPIPEGLHLLHSCDNPGCLNPAHLRPDTPQANRADCVAKGRQAKGDRSSRRLYPELYPPMRGERNGHAKITAARVIEMRQRYAAGGVSQSQLAREYEVNQAEVCRILNRKRWAHLE